MNLTRHSLLAATLWLTAFICGLYFNNDWQLALFGLSIATCFLWAGVMLWTQAQQGFVIPKSKTLLFLALFWALTLASVSWSDVPFISLMGFCFLSVMPLTLFAFVLRPDEAQIKYIAHALAGIAAILAVWAHIQFFLMGDYFGGRAHHPLADPNALGALFNLALFPALAWMMTTSDKKQSALALILSILLFGGIMTTASRGAFFGLVPALILFVALNKTQLKPNLKHLLIFAVAAILLFFLTTHGGRPVDNMIARVTDTVTLSLNDPTSNRIELWRGTWDMIRDHWLAGTGIATFYLYYPQYRVPEDAIGTYMAHSDPLQFWAEMGVLSPLLFYAALIGAALRTRRALMSGNLSPASRVAVISILCALVAVVAHTHVSFNFYNLGILFAGGYLLTVWFILTNKALSPSAYTLTFPAALSPGLRGGLTVLPLALIIYVFGGYVISEYFVNKGRTDIFEGRLESFSNNLNLAHKTGFQGNYRAYLLAANVPLGILQESGKAMPHAQQKELYDQAISFLSRAKTMNPRSASASYYLGKAQELVDPSVIPDGTPSPEDRYREALALDPTHLGSRMNLARLLENKGNKDDAFTLLKDGMRYVYRDPQALAFYGQTMMYCLERSDKDCREQILSALQSYKYRENKSLKRHNTSIGQQILGAEGGLNP